MYIYGLFVPLIRIFKREDYNHKTLAHRTIEDLHASHHYSLAARYHF